MRLPFITLALLPFAAAIFEPTDGNSKPNARRQQTPLMVYDEPDYTPQTNTGKPTLADLLTIDPSTSIFYSYARELELSRLLNDESAGLTLLAPTNKAVMALARKPHQGSETTDDTVISEEEFDKVSKRNVERWVSAHIIPEPLKTLEMRSYSTLLDGKSVTFSASEDSENSDWRNAVVEGGISIRDMKEASNGVIYVLDGTINLD
ncbi:hypothetical protein V5O48_002370 [Marasmius crinis-equi]|uniref:FAS1 domain-containing protein n=1 Tax=Marasmius crinis-equi TaxID=585013 RepID=A0ABR3FW39_9AGAR